jgi:hypothetical protein
MLKDRHGGPTRLSVTHDGGLPKIDPDGLDGRRSAAERPLTASDTPAARRNVRLRLIRIRASG